MSDPVLLAQGLTRRFVEGPIDVSVLNGVDLRVEPGQTLAIMGASGSGKSTLMHLLAGLDRPSSGTVRLMGQDLASLGPAALGAWRNRHLGFVYQFHHLLPELDVVDNVAMPLWIARVPRAEREDRARKILQAVGLAERAAHKPSELSGGERQRVAVARALVSAPACVLADEPTGNLDRATGQRVFDLMLELASRQSIAFVVVTHDEALAQRCQQIWRLEGGRLRPGA